MESVFRCNLLCLCVPCLSVRHDRSEMGVCKGTGFSHDAEAVGGIPHPGKKSELSTEAVPRHWGHCAMINGLVSAWTTPRCESASGETPA